MLNFRSLSGFIICHSSGPIAWKLICQYQTALSSGEAEIMSTNECAKEIQSLKHHANNIGIPEAYSHTKIYNNNKAAVQCAVSATSTGINHLNLQGNMFRKCHQSKYVDVNHSPGIINPSNFFTREMKDNTHYRNIRDSMMVSLPAFLKYNHNVPTHIITAKKILPYYSIRS